MIKLIKTAKLKFNHFNQNVTREQSERGNNYLLFTVNNNRL